MIDTIYIEDAVRNHPRTGKICAKFPDARIITCQRYGEVFNPKAQNFRLQKRKPALILAEKYRNFILPAPTGYGIGGDKNFYFSHMLNCLYDCRYCFLQGMLQSANYLLFVNYEDFQDEIRSLCAQHTTEQLHFFSGYDCDSLALEPVSAFAEAFLPVFQELPNAWLELRTKSTQVRSLLQTTAFERCIVAFSFTPQEAASALEYKAPSIARRVDAMCKLQQQGWHLGLRFDPIIYQPEYQQQYTRLFEDIFSRINLKQLHSVSLGMFRVPEKFFKTMTRLYPQEKLFAGPLQQQQGMRSYTQSIEQEMLQFCSDKLLQFIPETKYFPCLS